MKRILIITLVGVGILLAGTYISNDTIVEKSAPEIIERETVVDELEKRISDAQNANLSDVDAKAQSAYDEAYNQAMKEIELEVTKLYREEIETKETQLEKDVGVYWREDRNIVAEIKRVFPEQPNLFVKIAKGESGLQQWYPNGQVVRGIIDPDDTGLFQINNRYWREEAQKLGLDYENSIEDNIKMARHIYDVQGITAWVYYNNHLALVTR